MGVVRKRKVLKYSKERGYEEVEEEIVEKKSSASEQFKSVVSIASGLGFSIAFPIAGGAILGNFLDKKFQTAPKMTLSFIFLGIIISFVNIYYIVKTISKK